METDGRFYLGQLADEGYGTPYFYSPDDLTTHALVVGMTGSGKTGLCLNLLEEAALQHIPALMIDPKGDITNALLHFPALAPADFQPWVNPTTARREGQTVAELAERTAVAWRNGLAEWDIEPARLQQLADSAHFAIYTPGSDAGLKVSILASLTAPDLPWEANRELLREQIAGTVTAVLGLIGLKDIDPVRSREHILLANIFEHHWRQGQDLNLAALIHETQTPPFDRLGVFDVNTFFPEKERFELAMLLNNMLAAPAFQSWLEGESLDVARLLVAADGRPRHTIFYIAHLPEAERMFFVTLLLGAVETWMRRQTGAASLRALLYFDEIFGYLPPVSNPPTKPYLLRLLKQARAFGLGLLLATQNPADMDYKALSNMGTWFVGKLATDQDKQRLLDGLAAVEGSLNRRELDELISRLDKRVFLARNVHQPEPAIFRTRWVMNYLAGPLTREQIPTLNRLAGALPLPEAGSPMAEASSPITDYGLPVTASRPTLPAGISEFFWPVEGEPEEPVQYRPMLLAQAHITIRNRKYGVDTAVTRTILTAVTDADGRVPWQEGQIESVNRDELPTAPLPGAQFAPLPAPLSQTTTLRRMQQDWVDWLAQHAEVLVQANEQLGLYAGPDVPAGQFHQQCLEAVQPKIETEMQKAAIPHDRQINTLRQKIRREQQELEEDQADLSHHKQKEVFTHTKTVLGIFGRGRSKRLEQSHRQRRLTEKAEAEVTESQEALAAMQQELARLEAVKEQELVAARQKWIEVAERVTAVPLTPFKKDITVTLFGVAWIPYQKPDFLEKSGF